MEKLEVLKTYLYPYRLESFPILKNILIILVMILVNVMFLYYTIM